MIGYFLFPTLILSPWWLVQKARNLDPTISADRRYFVWKYLLGAMLSIGVLGAGINLGKDNRISNYEGQKGLTNVMIAAGAAVYHGKVIRKKK